MWRDILFSLEIARGPTPSHEGKSNVILKQRQVANPRSYVRPRNLAGVKDVRAIVHGHVELTDRVTNWERRHPHVVFVDNQLEAALAREIGMSWETL
jgi:hypothetical protein